MTERIILCSPASQPSGVPGSEARDCMRCGRKIWVSPSTRSYQQRSLLTQLTFLCPACCEKRARHDPIEEWLVPAEQRAEIFELTGLTAEEILAPYGITIKTI